MCITVCKYFYQQSALFRTYIHMLLLHDLQLSNSINIGLQSIKVDVINFVGILNPLHDGFHGNDNVIWWSAKTIKNDITLCRKLP